MLKDLINHSPDLQRLKQDGYELQILDGGYLLIHNVPYLTPDLTVKKGILVTQLSYSGNTTIKPETHVAYFIGECPSNNDGSRIRIVINHDPQVFNEIYTSRNTLSAKADYGDYYEKMTRYVTIFESQAQIFNEDASARTFEVFENTEEESVFVYPDTNTSRALISAVTNKLKGYKIAIIGLGGTGSYILDMLAKTPVAEIHLFDGDYFLQHNAFRAPGATPIEKFYERLKKTEYFKGIYSNMHQNIISHPDFISEDNINSLINMHFVFLSLDSGPIKRTIKDFLIEQKIPFINAGLGVEDIDNSLRAQVRITTCLPEYNHHIDKRISYVDTKDNLYDKNIQIADLNALNAIMAVIKWKKLMGFYIDLNNEHYSNYVTYTNEITSDDFPV